MILDREKIIDILGDNSRAMLHDLFNLSAKIKEANVGRFTYFRGLIEFSNICSKNCLYCGIRKDNDTLRYILSKDDVIAAARKAYDFGLGSVAIQAGEIKGDRHSDLIEELIYEIKKIGDGSLGITLSLGEQPFEVLQRWRNAGADRYLLRIESSSRELYQMIHPNDSMHSFDERIETLHNLKELNYQVGSGIMIGLPFQTDETLADDLLFLKKMDVDMCGMGPYLEHEATPLYQYSSDLMTKEERFMKALKMISLLRILMPNINIAATTALETIDPMGKEKGIRIGANIVMPNITPQQNKSLYNLYQGKRKSNECDQNYIDKLVRRIESTGDKVRLFEQGNSPRYYERNKR